MSRSTRLNRNPPRTDRSVREDVEACFLSGITDRQPDRHRLSMAKLSESQILRLVNESGHPNAQVLLRRPLIFQNCVEMQYQIDLDAKKPNERTLELRITHLANVNAARATMKRHLASSDRDLSRGVIACPDGFGNCALENRSTIFWWYLRHFVRVSVRTGTGPDLVRARAFSSVLNNHLIEFEADENALIFPQPTIDGSASVTLAQRSQAQLRMTNVRDTYDVKRTLVDNPEIFFITEGPTPDGMVEVFGRQPGTTQLSIFMAHVEYLTVVQVKFTITVTAVPFQLPEL